MRKILLVLISIAIIACSKESLPQAEHVEITYFPERVLLKETGFIEYKILPQDATPKSVVFSSSDNSVLSISKNGILTGNKVGNATIKISTKNGGSNDQCNIKVVEIDDFIDYYISSSSPVYPEYEAVELKVRFANKSEKDIQLKSFTVLDANNKTVLDNKLSGILKPGSYRVFKGEYDYDILPITLTVTYSYNYKEFAAELSYDI